MRLVKKNQKLHNPDSPLLIGDVKESDVVNEIREPSYIEEEQPVGERIISDSGVEV